jgi:hypothetical protein
MNPAWADCTKWNGRWSREPPMKHMRTLPNVIDRIKGGTN